MIAALKNQIRSKRHVKEPFKRNEVAYVNKQTRQLTDWRIAQKEVVEKERQKSLVLKNRRHEQIETLMVKKRHEATTIQRHKLNNIAFNTLQLEKEAAQHRPKMSGRSEPSRIRLCQNHRAENGM